jgi:glycosyltransferase involved in cell wall biosynthesis
MKVIFCIPTLTKPYQACLDSLAASVPLIDAAGWDHGIVSEIGSPYISNARATMLRKALDAKADVIIFIDHDLSWKPQDLLTLIQTEGDCVVGTYRYKREPEEYMGQLLGGIDGKPIIRADGALKTFCAPAGFLKITKHMVNRFMQAYPELAYGDRFSPHIDLFNHGAYEHVWYGEDYSMCRRWLAADGEIWTVPDLDIAHHTKDIEYKGNFHKFLLRQPGGSECPTE